MLAKLELTLTQLRETKPLVLCLTNYVTMDFMANCLLALGAAPIMSQDSQEIEELVDLSHVVNINTGTLDQDFLNRAIKASEYASVCGKSIILDPVGAGATQRRTLAAMGLMTWANIVRGNPSEIRSLIGFSGETLGVESVHQVNDAEEAAQGLVSDNDRVVVISGAEDLIVDKTRLERFPYGSSLMPLVTGMGCMLTAAIAAFKSVCLDAFEAASLATAYVGLCGQLAATETKSPGSFRMYFIDNLHQPDWDKIRKFIQV